MCDFYSEIGRQIGQQPETYHDATNSHSGMITRAGWRVNEPNRKTLVFEFECTLDALLSDCDLYERASSLIRNFGECPERLVKLFISNALKVRKALKLGIQPGDFDTEKYADVWNQAALQKVPVVLPDVFKGNLTVYDSAKLDAPQLKEVGGDLAVFGSAKLDAPQLKEVGGDLAVFGSAKLDALVEVGGNLAVFGSAKLDAPQLKEVGGDLAKLDALVEVGGNLVVYDSAKLDAPQLKEVGGDLAVFGSAKLDAPQLKEVGGNLAVFGSAKLDAPHLKQQA